MKSTVIIAALSLQARKVFILCALFVSFLSLKAYLKLCSSWLCYCSLSWCPLVAVAVPVPACRRPKRRGMPPTGHQSTAGSTQSKSQTFTLTFPSTLCSLKSPANPTCQHVSGLWERAGERTVHAQGEHANSAQKGPLDLNPRSSCSEAARTSTLPKRKSELNQHWLLFLHRTQTPLSRVKQIRSSTSTCFLYWLCCFVITSPDFWKPFCFQVFVPERTEGIYPKSQRCDITAM